MVFLDRRPTVRRGPHARTVASRWYERGGMSIAFEKAPVARSARFRGVRILAAGCATAALQVAVACRWPDRDQHVAVVALGWAGALWLTFLRGPSRVSGQASALETFAGAALWAAACCATVAGHAAYALPARFLPLVAGMGLAVALAGRGALREFRREQTLVALPIAYPLPFL